MKHKSGKYIAKSVRKEWEMNPVTRVKQSDKKYKRVKKIEVED